MIIRTNLLGRFGNQCLQYLHARARAERNGDTISTPQWIGEQIFDIPVAHRYRDKDSMDVTGYCQDQESLIYTRKQAREWFKFKPEIQKALSSVPPVKIACHRRVGDYEDLGYVVVSEQSYFNAAEKYFPGDAPLTFITEENPFLVPGLPDFLPDFYRIMTAEVIFRGNSTFSWVAATLSDAKVFSPIVWGLEGGREHLCEFTIGNWPRFANLDFTTDLHLKDE